MLLDTYEAFFNVILHVNSEFADFYDKHFQSDTNNNF